jgi:hypothetical protein
MNSRARAIPSGNSWLNATKTRSGLRSPFGVPRLIGRLHGPPTFRAESIRGVKSQEGGRLSRSRTAPLDSPLWQSGDSAERIRQEIGKSGAQTKNCLRQDMRRAGGTVVSTALRGYFFYADNSGRYGQFNWLGRKALGYISAQEGADEFVC